MKDDIYKNFKDHKVVQNTLHDISSAKKPIQIIDPRPEGVGNLLHVKRTRRQPFPPQQGECFFCGRALDEANHNHDTTVRGYCNKLCRKAHETQLIQEGRLQIVDPNPRTTLQRSGEANSNWAKGWWENISPEPIYIENETHLRKVCEKHGVMAKALLKPKSRDRGYEMR